MIQSRLSCRGCRPRSAGLDGIFDVIISSDEVGRGKPARDVFLETARRLGVAPGACAVVEDSGYGVTAAQRAGMRCIAIPYRVGLPMDEAISGAELLLQDGMASVDGAGVFEWIRATRA